MNESEKCAQKDLAHIWHPASQMKDYEDFPPIIIDHGKGVKLYDVDGKEYTSGSESTGSVVEAKVSEGGHGGEKPSGEKPSGEKPD